MCPDQSSSAADEATAPFRQVLDPAQIDARPREHGSTIGAERRIAGILKPRDVAQVQAILRIAAATGRALHPVSTGRNWGYGDALPVRDGCILVDLSGMNRIIDVDAELGVATVEPGVTQGQLRAWLDDRKLGFMVPVTGAGPDCSLIGNALERGFGITPHADHFGAITALEAVLPDGRLYRSSFAEQGAADIDRAFKWGIGPYLDGLFAQGGFGIVTQASLALAPRPAVITAFAFQIADPDALGDAVETVRALLRQPGLSLSGINLMNAPRVLALLEPYPADERARAVVPADLIAAGRRRHGLGAWTGIGALYGTPAGMRAAIATVRRALRPIDARPQFFSARLLARLGLLVRCLPPALAAGARARLLRAQTLMDVFAGVPTSVALALAYWRPGAPALPVDRAPDPARDGCGLLWYAPVVPMTARAVHRFADLVACAVPQHGFNPLITLTSLSDRAFDGTVPIVFRQPDERARAQACYAALLAEGRAAGFLPYRLPITAMSAWTGVPDSVFWDTVRRVKAALDPDAILSPGRYAP
jgi:FAD/FMN-containing dehydrogenase